MSGVICSITQTFLASSIILPHKPKSKNQPLFSNSTKLCCCQTQTHCSVLTKQTQLAHSTFWFNFRHARISSDCCMLLRQPLHRMPHTHTHRKKYAPRKPVMLMWSVPACLRLQLRYLSPVCQLLSMHFCQTSMRASVSLQIGCIPTFCS